MGSTPGSTREICGEIQVDGWFPLTEGWENSCHCFYDQRLAGGKFTSLKKMSQGFLAERHFTHGTLS